MSKSLIGALVATTILFGTPAFADELSLVAGSIGKDIEELRGQLDAFEKASGHTVKIVTMPASTTDQFGQYRLWLSAGNKDIDVYRTDVIWAPQLASNFIDLTEAMKDVVGQHSPSVIASQTVGGKLVAMPLFADAPALYYRKDLLEKYGKAVPKTWAELSAHREGDPGQGARGRQRADERLRLPRRGLRGPDLRCAGVDRLQWRRAGRLAGGRYHRQQREGGGSARHGARLGRLRSRPVGVTGYMEEEARGVWQTGNAVFMRNWPYAFPLGNGDDSPIKGKFDVAPLPAGEGGQSAACLGGWNLAVSDYSEHKPAAIDLVKFLASPEAQKERALGTSRLPSIPALYDDPDIKEKQPLVAQWKTVFEKATPRPSAPTKAKYNEVSQQFWTAVNRTLSGQGDGATNLDALEKQLRRLKRSDW